jgi:alpha-L-fucosidase
MFSVKDTIVTNDRWGSNGVMCHHGDFYTCDDRYNPGKLQNHKWENCMTSKCIYAIYKYVNIKIDLFSVDSQSWGYRRNAKLEDYLSAHDLISSMAETVR